MLLHWILFVSYISFVFSREKYNRLSPEENEDLQRNCGSSNESFPTFDELMYGYGPRSGNVPYLVSITYNPKWRPDMDEAEWINSQVLMCSGTLISSRHILTATSCLGLLSASCHPPQPEKFLRRNLRRLRVYAGGLCTDPKDCWNRGYSGYAVGNSVKRAFIASYFTDGMCLDEMMKKRIHSTGNLMVIELEKDFMIGRRVFPACLPPPSVSDLFVKVTAYESFLHKRTGECAYMEKTPKTRKSVFLDLVDLKKEFPDVVGFDVAGVKNWKDLKAEKSVQQMMMGGPAIIVASEKTRATVAAVVSSGYGCNGFPVEPQFTLTDKHNLWICQMTGICVDREHIKHVEQYKGLPRSSQPTWAYVLDHLPYEMSFQ